MPKSHKKLITKLRYVTNRLYSIQDKIAKYYTELELLTGIIDEEITEKIEDIIIELEQERKLNNDN